MTFKDIPNKITLGEVSNYSTEKISIDVIDRNNYVSTENLLPNFGGKKIASGIPTSNKVNSYLEGDILVSNIRPYFRKVWFANQNGGASNDVLVIRPNNNIDRSFLYYSLANNEFIDFVMSGAKGTKMPRGDKNHIMTFQLLLPCIREQKAIANILSTLDEKIEVNNQINETLENMAQELFKRWFVDFEFPNENGEPYKSSGGEMIESELGLIPKGWSTKRIIDLDIFISDYVANGSFKSLKDNVKLNENKDHALFIRNVDLKNNFSSKKYVDKRSYEFLSKTKLYGNEVIISNVADVGRVYLCPQFSYPMTLGNNVILLKAIQNSNLNYFYYRLFKSEFGQHLLGTITNGSAQLKFNKTDFKNLKIVYPSESSIMAFFNVQIGLETLIQKNIDANNKLKQIRDTLLPKLMSGEIRVPLEDLEESLTEVKGG